MRRAALIYQGLAPARAGATFSTTTAAHDTLALSEAKTGGGILSKLFGGGSRLSIPLTDALDTVEIPSQAPPATKPTTQLSKLSNGVRVASEAVVVSMCTRALISELCSPCHSRAPPSAWVSMWMQGACMKHLPIAVRCKGVSLSSRQP